MFKKSCQTIHFNEMFILSQIEKQCQEILKTLTVVKSICNWRTHSKIIRINRSIWITIITTPITTTTISPPAMATVLNLRCTPLMVRFLYRKFSHWINSFFYRIIIGWNITRLKRSLHAKRSMNISIIIIIIVYAVRILRIDIIVLNFKRHRWSSSDL